MSLHIDGVRGVAEIENTHALFHAKQGMENMLKFPRRGKPIIKPFPYVTIGYHNNYFTII